MLNNIPFTWNWVIVVLVHSVPIYVVSCIIVIYILKVLIRQTTKINKLLRWILVLPTAFLTGQIIESICQILFASYEIFINHKLTFKPGFEVLTWQALSPIFFVVGGMIMAPSRKIHVVLVLGGVKLAVAIVNIMNIMNFIKIGGEWTRVDPILGSPLWWNINVYVIGLISIICVTVFGLYHTITSDKRL